MVEPVTTTIVIVKGICWACTALGIGYCAKKAHDAYDKGQKTKREKLSLKGKSLEQARLDNERAREEEKKSRQELEELDEKIKKLENELEETRNKLNDPNLDEDERGKLKRKIVGLEDELSDLRHNKKSIFDRLKQLTGRIKDNNSIIAGTVSNLDDRHWIWEFLTLENILIMGGCYALYKILKDDKK